MSGAQKKARRSAFPQEKGRTARPYQPFGPPGKTHPAAAPPFPTVPGHSRHPPGRRFKGKDTTIPAAASGRAFPPSGRFFPHATPCPDTRPTPFSGLTARTLMKNITPGTTFPGKRPGKSTERGRPMLLPAKREKKWESSPGNSPGTSRKHPEKHPHSLFPSFL